MTTPFAVYDTRHYPTVDVGTGYRQWAPLYDQTVDSQLDLPLLEKLHTIPWPSLQTAVDLACGTGRIGAWLHQHGIPHIHGVDCAPAMLAQAAAKQVYAQLCQADLVQCPLPSQAYDLGLTVLAACHVPDVSALYAEAARLLRPGGFFVLVDYHPFFLLRGIPTHFDRASGDPLAIENWVHFLSDHINAGRAVQWTVLEMHERVVDQAWLAQRPGMRAYVNQPVSFVLVWQAGA